jgi:predicted lipoprotein with Yx(FWY)xxD motif
VLCSRRIPIATLAATAIALTAASGAVTTAGARTPRSPAPSSSVEVGTAKIAKLGGVLVRGSGHALYVFQPSGPREACAACQKIWIPLLAPASGVARATGTAKQTLIGSVKDPVIGKRVVTYDGWPLYTYVLDTTKDEATGQDIKMGGGYWRVLTPAGKVVSTAVTHGVGDVGS